MKRLLDLFTDTPAQMDIPLAVMIPMVAAMLADGHVHDSELLQIRTICWANPALERHSATEIEKLTMQAARLIEDRGVDVVCGQAAEVLSPSLREVAYRDAAQIIASDGHVGALEIDVMRMLAGVMAIEDTLARSIVDDIMKTLD